MFIIANGGMKFHNHENTLESILLTKNASYVDGVLIDVRLTFDNHLVVFRHDDLGIDTLGKGYVSKMTYNELRKVKFPSKIFKYHIPTLEEVLSKYNCTKILILNLHDALSKNSVLVNEIIKLLNKYPLYNYYLETSSIDLLGYLFEKAHDYKIGPRLACKPIKSTNGVSFCDTLYDNSNSNINTYSNILVRDIDNQNSLEKVMENVLEHKKKDLFIISNYPKRIYSIVNQIS